MTLVAGAGLYFLDKTLGETIKEGYINSNLHHNLRDFFKRQIDDKSLFIAENIRRIFSSKKAEVSVRLLLPSDTEPNRIILEIKESEGMESPKQIGSISQELDKDR